MSGRWSLLAVLLVTGCHGLPQKKGRIVSEGDPSPPACTDDAGQPCPPAGTSGGGAPRVGAACQPCAKPQVEIQQPPPDIQVNVPRQRIVLPRRPGCGTPTAPASVSGFPSSPSGIAGRPGTITDQQAMVQTRQVVLMPQQVLVPFVQTTVSGPIRLTETQESSLLSVTGTATSGAVVASGQVSGQVSGQLTVSGAAGTSGANAAPNSAASTASTANVQNMTECLAQLRQYELKIAQLMAQTEALAAQVERLKGAPPK